MPVTLKHLAQELGLDYSTVSYALSGKGSINEATRLRVREMADRMGYVPNGLARRMQAQSTRNLGLVLPDSLLVYNELIQQLYRGTTARDFELQIALSEFQEAAEERAVRSFLEARVDGIVIRSHYGLWAEVPAGSALRQAAARKLPLVTFGPCLSDSPFPAVELPMRDRTLRAALHLLELGHRHLACLLPVEGDYFASHRSAIAGMEEALRIYGADGTSLSVLALEPSDEVAVEVGQDGSFGSYMNETLPRRAVARGRILLQRALSLTPRPTGVVCYNAVTCIGAVREARAQCLRVPDDVAFVSTSRNLVSELSPLSLTTCDVPPGAAATATLGLLFAALEGRTDPVSRITIEPTLHVGETTVAERR